MFPRPLRVALLCGARAPGVERLLEESARFGREYELVGAVTTTDDCAARSALEAAGVPVAVNDVDRFERAFGARMRHPEARRAYDLATLAILSGRRPDLVLLSAYLYILSEPMLKAFPGRIVNVHDSDLTVLGSDRKPRWRGLRSTRDAIADGARETRSTAHVVTAEVDEGPVVALSDPFPVHPLAADAVAWGAEDIVSAYAYAQREWMMRAAWGELLDRAARRFARGAVEADVLRPRVAVAAGG